MFALNSISIRWLCLVVKISQELYAIQISASTDIIIQARSNVQPAELEVLLYDIYVGLEEWRFLF